MNGTVLSISRSLVEFQILIIETSMPAPKMRSEMTPIGLRSYYSRTAAAGKVVPKRVVLWLLVTFQLIGEMAMQSFPFPANGHVEHCDRHRCYYR